MLYSYIGETANEVWEKAFLDLEKSTKSVESRAGQTVENLHSIFQIENPVQRWVTRRWEPISPSFALAEIIWILSGSNDAKLLNTWNPALPKYAGYNDVYHGAYGYRIRKNNGFDQLERAYNALRNNAQSRQVVISIWDARIDMPNEKGEPADSDIPCNICSFLKVRQGKLDWTQMMRSNDIHRGFPYNVIQYTTLQEILAGWLGLEVGTYTHYSDSLHYYTTDCFEINGNIDICSNNTDSLNTTKEQFDEIISKMYQLMQIMAFHNISEQELTDLVSLSLENEAYDNIMAMITLYIAHKKGYNHLEQKLLSTCTNKVYCDMWNAWLNRKKKSKSIDFCLD